MKIRMVLEHQDPFFDNYSNEIFALHGIIDSMKVSPDNLVTVTLNKALFPRIILSHIHAIRRISHPE